MMTKVMKPSFISLRDMPLRYKLMAGYSGILVFIALLGGTATYFLVRNAVEANIESELQRTTANVLNMVRTTGGASIRNRLRAIAVTNRSVAEYFHSEYQQGHMTEDDAKSAAGRVMKSQTIGTTGYLYCLNSKGVLVMHPKGGLLGRDISEYRFIQDQMKRKEGYLEYDWKNPGEKAARPKALYMVYYEPWDWIISASSYREEFSELISVDDFRASVLSLRFADTGYSYILDGRGRIVLHPYLTGDLYDAEDSTGAKFVHEICKNKYGKIVYTWQNPGEKEFRKKLAFFNYIPEFDWIVVSTSYHDEFFRPLDAVRNVFIAIALCTLLFIVPVSLWIGRTVTRSIERLKAGFERGAGGDLSVRLTPKSQDEIGMLNLYFNNFMEQLEEEGRRRRQAEEERLEMAEQLQQSQKMEAIGQLAGGVAHDFNNILTAVLGSAELLRIQTKGQYAALIENIIHASTRAAGLTRNLLDFSRKGTFQNIPVDIHAMLRETAELLSHSIDKRIEVALCLESENHVVTGDPGKLQNAFLNLGINARDAMPMGGRLEFAARNVTLETETHVQSGLLAPCDYIVVSVTDTGVGIDPSNIDRIFEPFFTTKAEGKGTGLGLASVYGCVAIHNGELDVRSNPGEGTTFDIYLPSPKYKMTVIENAEPTGLLKGEGHVMIIDDEEVVRVYTERALVELGYTVSVFDDPEKALNYAEHAHAMISLVILDLMMPKMSGKETLSALLNIDPKIPVIIASGFSSRQEGDLLKEGARRFLRKPFRFDELSRFVARHKR
jgi:signal transduction histidine kinase